MLTVFKSHVTPDQTRDVIAAFEEGAVAHTGEDVASAELASLVEQVPALRPAVARSPAATSHRPPSPAVAFVLEGLHLSKRLNKDRSAPAPPTAAGAESAFCRLVAARSGRHQTTERAVR